jgi:hypothetical protein
MGTVYSVETIDWSCDCIWDAWLRGVFSSKEKVQDHLFAWKNTNGINRFRVLEIEIDDNLITGGWIILVGDNRFEWHEADPDDVKFMGR